MINMFRSALDVAKYVINRCYVDLRHPISNLQLQKILYYIQGYYLVKFGRPLFYEDIIAWKLGPVVREVYNEYNIYVSSPITEVYNVDLNLSSDERVLINNVIDNKALISAWDLVNATHNENPWKDTVESRGYNSVMRNQDIAQYFVNNQGV